MPVLLFLVKTIGILLLLLLALVLLALVLPVGVRLDYQHGILRVFARIGPVELSLWPRPAKKRTGPSTPPGNSGRVMAKDQPERGAPEPARPAADLPQKAVRAQAAEPPRTAALPGFLQQRVDAVLHLAHTDPLRLADCALGHLSWAGRRAVRGIRVTRLTVFWTVHCPDDAATTAIAYGSQITLLNNLLLRLREHMTIRSESLRLEPDFTGEMAGRRQFSCCIHTQLYRYLFLGARLLRRVWRDPVLQPEPVQK